MTPDRDPARIIAGGQPLLAAAPGAGGHIATNLLAFTRLLRRSGLPLGPGEALSALAALAAIDIGDRRQVHAALRAVMVHRREHFELFDQAFQLFWRDPEAAAHAAAMAALDGHKPPSEKPPPASRRLAEAMQGEKPKPRPPEPEPPRHDMSFTVSDREKLQKLDFEAMSAAEIAAAKQEIRKLSLPLDEKPTRRFRTHYLGVDCPAEEIARFALEVDACAVLVSLVMPENEVPAVQQLHKLAELLVGKCEVWVGGFAARSLSPDEVPAGCLLLPSGNAFEQRLDLLAAQYHS